MLRSLRWEPCPCWLLLLLLLLLMLILLMLMLAAAAAAAAADAVVAAAADAVVAAAADAWVSPGGIRWQQRQEQPQPFPHAFHQQPCDLAIFAICASVARSTTAHLRQCSGPKHPPAHERDARHDD